MSPLFIGVVVALVGGGLIGGVTAHLLGYPGVFLGMALGWAWGSFLRYLVFGPKEANRA